MKPLRRSSEAALPQIAAIVIILLVAAVVFLALFALGFLGGPTGSDCPPSVCPIGGPKPVWFKVVSEVAVQTPAGGALGLANPRITMELSTKPLTGSFPGLLFDANWKLHTTLDVTYPNGETHEYTAPVKVGTNYETVDVPWWIQGPASGTYQITVTFFVEQYNCAFCSAGTQTTTSATFTF